MSHEALHESYVVQAHNFASAGEVSASIKRLLRHIGIDFGVIRRVSIAAYEVELNLVIHSRGGRIDLEIIPPIEIGGETGWLHLTSTDVGPGIRDVDLAMQEGWSTATDDVRDLGFGAGMGLPNMRRNADSFEITSEYGVGTTIKMGFKIQ
ncbi:MAG: ATP-binding protein [Oscillospiraceae bacterium]|nr:ATP-binding protein [Oscillospiraceae bacterium]